MNPLSPHTIVVSPIGDVKTGHMTQVRQGISQAFGCPTEILPVLEDISFAFDAGRNQYCSTVILEALERAMPENTVKVLAITGEDLYIPILTYVYGEAQLAGKTCIVSTYRLREDLSPLNSTDTLAARITKEAVHELGHTFNLRHCKDPVCTMHYCRSIKDVDRKSHELCRYCRVLLSDELKKLSVETR